MKSDSEISAYGMRVSFRDSLRSSEFFSLVFSAFLFFVALLFFSSWDILIVFFGFGHLLELSYSSYDFVSIDTFFVFYFILLIVMNFFFLVFMMWSLCRSFVDYLYLFQRPSVVDCRFMDFSCEVKHGIDR